MSRNQNINQKKPNFKGRRLGSAFAETTRKLYFGHPKSFGNWIVVAICCMLLMYLSAFFLTGLLGLRRPQISLEQRVEASKAAKRSGLDQLEFFQENADLYEQECAAIMDQLIIDAVGRQVEQERQATAQVPANSDVDELESLSWEQLEPFLDPLVLGWACGFLVVAFLLFKFAKKIYQNLKRAGRDKRTLIGKLLVQHVDKVRHGFQPMLKASGKGWKALQLKARRRCRHWQKNRWYQR